MLTPIIKQGDEHIYILLKIGIIDWMSGCYMGVYGFVRMLIGSEITYAAAQISIDKRLSCTASDDALSIFA